MGGSVPQELARRARRREATAPALLRLAGELLAPRRRDQAPTGRASRPRELTVLAAFGFSPLWLLAEQSQAALTWLASELEGARSLPSAAAVRSPDDLAAALGDLPGLEREELQASLAELRTAADLPPPGPLLAALRDAAEEEGSALLEVSEGVGLAFLLAARKAARERLDVPYRDDWWPLAGEGFAAYARRVGGAYREAVAGHADSERPTWAEHVLGRVPRDV